MWRDTPFEELPIGRGEMLREGSKIALLTIGTTASAASKAIDMIDADGSEVAHYDLRYAKPLDNELLDGVATKFDCIITVEDGAIRGGVGEAVAAYMLRRGHSPEIVNLGVEDRFIEHGRVSELHAECGIDAASIAAQLSKWL